MILVPTSDRILVKPLQVDQKYGSLFVPDFAKTGIQRGTVINAGEYVTEFQIGETVFFRSPCGTSIRYNDEDFLIIDRDDVLAKEE